ncbi:hypothetical protein Taro_012688 [Colocasia esculenta]|uniref:Late embryogenesis abundant protein LEA-2 subgroup domain-containing protein n=1 Tax=Colocasia esculenta TaxID=4460 RepID=A0A843UE87_COLES|nr:hypothetical protein [Colocasia esculenta]
MADRVYPASKSAAPAPNGAAAGAGAPAFPATKAQMYGAARPAYRPQAPKRRRGRGCCCCCCCWLTLLLVALILLAAIAGGVFYVLYRPHRPSFSVTSLRLSALNVTAANALTSRLDITVAARNPNKKLVFLYDTTSIAVSTGGVQIGDGSFPAFVHEAKNTTLLKASVTSSGQSLDSTAAADLKKKSSLPLEIQMETRAGVKVGSLKTKKIRIRVSCSGVSVAVPKGKAAPPAASSPDASCKVELRIKIWKWYV